MNNDNVNVNRVLICDLVKYKETLKHMHSFAANIDKCNFNVEKSLVSYTMSIGELMHGLPEHRPTLTGCEASRLYGVKSDDYVVLTPDQLKDYKLIAGINDD